MHQNMWGNERKERKKEVRKHRSKEAGRKGRNERHVTSTTQSLCQWRSPFFEVLKAPVVFTASFLRCGRKDAAQSIWKGRTERNDVFQFFLAGGRALNGTPWIFQTTMPLWTWLVASLVKHRWEFCLCWMRREHIKTAEGTATAAKGA